jgi:hypothetical protein
MSQGTVVLLAVVVYGITAGVAVLALRWKRGTFSGPRDLLAPALFLGISLCVGMVFLLPAPFIGLISALVLALGGIGMAVLAARDKAHRDGPRAGPGR